MLPPSTRPLAASRGMERKAPSYLPVLPFVAPPKPLARGARSAASKSPGVVGDAASNSLLSYVSLNTSSWVADPASGQTTWLVAGQPLPNAAWVATFANGALVVTAVWYLGIQDPHSTDTIPLSPGDVIPATFLNVLWARPTPLPGQQPGGGLSPNTKVLTSRRGFAGEFGNPVYPGGGCPSGQMLRNGRCVPIAAGRTPKIGGSTNTYGGMTAGGPGAVGDPLSHNVVTAVIAQRAMRLSGPNNIGWSGPIIAAGQTLPDDWWTNFASPGQIHIVSLKIVYFQLDDGSWASFDAASGQTFHDFIIQGQPFPTAYISVVLTPHAVPGQQPGAGLSPNGPVLTSRRGTAGEFGPVYAGGSCPSGQMLQNGRCVLIAAGRTPKIGGTSNASPGMTAGPAATPIQNYVDPTRVVGPSNTYVPGPNHIEAPGNTYVFGPPLTEMPGTIYVVQPHDTWSSIANHFGMDVGHLQTANPHLVYNTAQRTYVAPLPGTTIQIPGAYRTPTNFLAACPPHAHRLTDGSCVCDPSYVLNPAGGTSCLPTAATPRAVGQPRTLGAVACAADSDCPGQSTCTELGFCTGAGQGDTPIPPVGTTATTGDVTVPFAGTSCGQNMIYDDTGACVSSVVPTCPAGQALQAGVCVPAGGGGSSTDANSVVTTTTDISTPYKTGYIVAAVVAVAAAALAVGVVAYETSKPKHLSTKHR